MVGYEYVGCFFDYKELSEKVKKIRQNPLECEKMKPHVTFEYAPSVVDTTLFGEKIFVTITGYGNDGRNEGVQVVISCENQCLESMAQKIEVPHITLAVSSTGQAVNTKYLKFEKVEPLSIIGYYDGHIED